MFDSFCRGALDLDRINRSYMAMIAKKKKKEENALTVAGFRPISLLNCLVKMITKVLAARLQHEIRRIVDTDQSGFSGRHASRMSCCTWPNWCNVAIKEKPRQLFRSWTSRNHSTR